MIVLVMLISVLSLGFALFLARQVLAADTGTPQMQDIASAIKEGAEAFLRRQNRTIAVIGAGVAVLIFVLYAAVRPHNPNDPTTTFNMAIATTLSFVFGALCSGVAGYIGMFVSIRANLRTASAVRSSLNRALQIALRGGAVSGLFVVAMSLLGVGGLFALMRAFGVADEKIPLLIVGYGFGASLVALFAQLGGGIYTKAADVGADLVGKVEAGIPEDDPRNPAVIADLVGDNVGDCARRSSRPRGSASFSAGWSASPPRRPSSSSRSTTPSTATVRYARSPRRRRPGRPRPSSRGWRSPSSAPRSRPSSSRSPSSSRTSSAARRASPTRVSSGRRSPPWACSPPRPTSSPWTPSARSRTTQAVSSR